MDFNAKALLYSNVPALVFVFIYFIRMEKKVTRLETCIEMLIKRLDRCQPNLEKHT